MEVDFDVVHEPQFRRLCRFLSERSPLPMVAVEGTSHIVSYVNSAFSYLVGKDRQELAGVPFATAVPEGEENGCLALLDRVFRTGRSENLLEQEHRQIQSRPVYWSYSMWAVLGEDDRPAGVMIQITDSTEAAIYRHQVMEMNEALFASSIRQQELADEAESLNAKLQLAVKARDHFLAVLSHELRNPLAALVNGMQLLKHMTISPDAAESSRIMMQRQLKQMVRLVDDLLDVSRVTTGKLELHNEPMDLGTVLRDAIGLSRSHIESAGHELIVTLPNEPVELEADPTRLTQVFMNLLSNAAKYSDPGGRIQISAERIANEVLITVEDSGIGISASNLPRLFEAFMQVDEEWSRAQGGLGIGLWLVKQFVELHGARIDAHSDGPGKGSRFIVGLPFRLPTNAQSSTPPLKKSLGSSRRVLVVDDNRDAGESLAELLKSMNHDVRTAHDGATGLALAAEFRPDVILMDLEMPTMDGYEAARRIRAQPWGSRPFLVAVTGLGAIDDRRRTSEARFDRHLTKPVDPTKLEELMENLRAT